MASNAWSEEEYTRYLEKQRDLFAWVMRTYGDMEPENAREAAVERYPYEPPSAPHRGLIFHDMAWHWAMRAIEGEDYPRRRPDLIHPPAEYWDLV